MKLNDYTCGDYTPGNKLKIGLWLLFSYVFFETKIPFPSSFKCKILRLFGAKLGKGVVIKPSVKIKYPWFLTIGSYSWIGEKVWIDNLVNVKIGTNCCLSQQAYILTGNHDFRDEKFSLITGEVELQEGVWVGAKAIVAPSVVLHINSVLCAGSLATKSLKENTVYIGVPAKERGERYLTTGDV
jgi:putative colanic acid biosynthesis acetyltransferase WcaF